MLWYKILGIVVQIQLVSNQHHLDIKLKTAWSLDCFRVVTDPYFLLAWTEDE